MRTLFTTLACLGIFALHSYATTYYVIPSGNNANTGLSPSAPLADINYALNKAAPYDTINVYGIYDIYGTHGTVVISKPITLLGFGAELDGGGRLASTLSKRLLVISNASDVLVDGFVCKNLIGNYSIGIEILGSGRNITIRHSLITNIGWTPNNLSAVPSTSNNANGILVHGTTSTPLSQVHILEDTITNCALGYSEALTVAGNTDTFSVIGNYVYANSNIGIDIAGHTNLGANPPSAVNYARNGLIARNVVFRCMSPIAVSSGIYIDGASNCTVNGNWVFNNAVGIAVGQERMTGVGAKPCSQNRIINNLITRNVAFGLLIGSENFSTNPQTINNYVGGNLLFKNRTGEVINGVSQIGTPPGPYILAGTANGNYGDIFGGEIQFLNCDSVVVENNIVYPLGERRCINVPPPRIATNIRIQYNDFYKEQGNVYINIDGGSSLNGQAGPLWTSNANILGLDTNTKKFYPKFTDTLANDFRLDSSSLCINAGNPATTTATAGTADYYSNLRIINDTINIGPHEAVRPPAVTIPKVVSISNFDVKIYPNPARDILAIEANQPIAELIIIDITGQVIHRIQKPIASIDVSRLEVGVYQLQFVTSHEEIVVKKLVKL